MFQHGVRMVSDPYGENNKLGAGGECGKVAKAQNCRLHPGQFICTWRVSDEMYSESFCV